jgi:hypothetical protein
MIRKCPERIRALQNGAPRVSGGPEGNQRLLSPLQMQGENHMAHDRVKAETTETAHITRTEFHDEPEHKHRVHHERVHFERETHRRPVKLIKRSVSAYASDAELFRVAAQLSGSARGDETRRSRSGTPPIPPAIED